MDVVVVDLQVHLLKRRLHSSRGGRVVVNASEEVPNALDTKNEVEVFIGALGLQKRSDYSEI